MEASDLHQHPIRAEAMTEPARNEEVLSNALAILQSVFSNGSKVHQCACRSPSSPFIFTSCDYNSACSDYSLTYSVSAPTPDCPQFRDSLELDHRICQFAIPSINLLRVLPSSYFLSPVMLPHFCCPSNNRFKSPQALSLSSILISAE
jgi:hypothetical protein